MHAPDQTYGHVNGASHDHGAVVVDRRI